MSDCLKVCTKSTGCNERFRDTHRICKANRPYSYKNLITHFDTYFE